MRSSKTPKRSAATVPVPLSITNAESLLWEVQQIQLEVARRAYELFELRGYEHGHDWEDWFRAESELLRPVSMVISETDDRISIRANVGNFAANDLRVAWEPRRAIVLGRKGDLAGVTTPEGSRDQLVCLIDLPAEIASDKGAAELEGGLLKVELVKAGQSSRAAAAGT
jgi:HSP20 family protein